MTSYAHTITVNDSETIALEAALKLMIKHCQQKINEGANVPYVAHRLSSMDILERLYDNRTQKSGNNFKKNLIQTKKK